MNTLKGLFLCFSKKQSIRIYKNFISQIVSNSSQTILQIIFPPLMIMIYGLENFGIWIFLTAIPSLLSILNFDLNAGARTEMSIYFNKNNKKKINEIFNNSIVITLIFVVSLVIIGFFIITFYDFNLNILKNINSDELKIILFCIFSSFYLHIFNAIFKTGITYWGKFYISTYIEIYFDLFAKILILISGLILSNLLFAFVILFCSSVVKSIFYYYFFLHFNKSLTIFSFDLISKKQILRLLKLSTPYYLESICNILKHSSQIIIIGIFFNAQVVGLISTTKTLFYFFPTRIWDIILKTIFYEFTKLYAEKNFNKLKNIYVNFLKLGLLFIVIFIFTSLSIGEHVYNLWLNNSYNLDFNLLILIVLDLVFFISATSISFVNKSINKFFQITFFQTVINITIIIISYLLFINQQSYYFLFLFNLIGSIIIFIYSVFFSLKLKILRNYKKK
jgi:O-antigen/teichoic acid export membrane protein